MKKKLSTTQKIDYKEAIAEIDKAIAYLCDTRRQLNEEWKKSMGIKRLVDVNYAMDKLELDVKSICVRSRYEDDLIDTLKEQV